MDVWLPSIRGPGKYLGDILIVDYDLEPGAAATLQKQPHIILKKAKQLHPCILSDRIRAFHEALHDLYNVYNVVMCVDGNDVEFLGPIEPLLKMGEQKLCYATETRLNREWVHAEGITNAEAIWDAMKDQPIINAGMFVAPAKQMRKILEYITGVLKENSILGYDQLGLNAMVYYHKTPSQNVGNRWNYDAREITVLHRI
jgi:hypothetical protein